MHSNNTQMLKDVGKGYAIFKFILIALICVAIIGQLSGTSNKQYFGSFLQFIGDCPQLGNEYVNFKELQLTNWGFTIPLALGVEWYIDFNWLRDIVWKPFIGIVNIIQFLLKGMVNSVGYAFYFIKFFFGY